MILKTNRWMVVVCAAFLITGCGGEAGADLQKELKPPSVYRDPQISVTRAPTVTAADLPTPEPSATVVAVQQFVDPVVVDNEQFFMNEIEYLLDKIERKLDQIDINP